MSRHAAVGLATPRAGQAGSNGVFEPHGTPMRGCVRNRADSCGLELARGALVFPAPGRGFPDRSRPAGAPVPVRRRIERTGWHSRHGPQRREPGVWRVWQHFAIEPGLHVLIERNIVVIAKLGIRLRAALGIAVGRGAIVGPASASPNSTGQRAAEFHSRRARRPHSTRRIECRLIAVNDTGIHAAPALRSRRARTWLNMERKRSGDAWKFKRNGRSMVIRRYPKAPVCAESLSADRREIRGEWYRCSRSAAAKFRCASRRASRRHSFREVHGV